MDDINQMRIDIKILQEENELLHRKIREETAQHQVSLNENDIALTEEVKAPNFILVNGEKITENEYLKLKSEFESVTQKLLNSSRVEHRRTSSAALVNQAHEALMRQHLKLTEEFSNRETQLTDLALKNKFLNKQIKLYEEEISKLFSERRKMTK